MRRPVGQMLLAAAVTGGVISIGSLILQRWVAQTRGAAIAMVIAWFVVVLIGLFIVLRNRADLRMAALGTYGVVLLVTVAVGYWTGFRDDEVDEDVVIAETEAEGAEREAALAGSKGEAGDEGATASEPEPEPAGPVSLAKGSFTGEDGHAGEGTAEVVEEPNGDRALTFTDFDVDPGVMVEVYLSPSTGDVSDVVDLGSLKGNVGDQQYEIPADADLGKYSNVVLYCTPFSVRIAVAELDV